MDADVASDPPSTAQEANDRRKSARTIRKPQLYATELDEASLLSNGSTKRKRAVNGDIDEEENEDEEGETSSEESEGEADEEELREKRLAARAKTNGKPASKKPRTSNGAGATLAIRSANLQGRQPSKTAKVQQARARKSQVNAEGLYAQVFGRGKSGDDAAAEWLRAYQKNNVNAMCDLINFVLKCTGCDLKVDTHDIEDVDNATSKLGDLQDEYQQAKIADYPLISRLKQYSGFRTVVVDFFTAVIKTMHVSSTLYEDTALFENVQIWVDTMSSAAIRPFRHTATVIALTISTTLCEVARELQSSISTTRGQIETEKKKKSMNKGRVNAMQETLKADEKKIEVIDTILKDEFDVVFVHRYRDVDPKIRTECVAALGTWITTYRQMFLEGQYLRYLGWVLSDTVAQTRSEVIKQLKILFKNPRNVAALRAFTDRFRPRMVEMAARDTEPGVRADTIELMDKLRDAELLEPDDIDTVGQLVFDTEPRVRKAVAKFFVSSIEDLYKANTEDLDKEQYDTALPSRDDDYLVPTQQWIKFKCLAQTLTSYDEGDESEGSRPQRSRDVLPTAELDSRYMLATQSIFPFMKELQDWEALAGYLLYDHSQITASPDDADVAAAAQAIYKLNEGEETVLLEVLDYAVKLYLLQIVETQTEKKKGKKSQATKDEILEKQELAAHNLTLIIPQLLNKFGSTPQAATAILRLEHLLNVDLINDLQQNDTTYSALLDDINKQFMSHSDRQVLAEAGQALLNGRRYEQSKEATENKVQEMWDDALSTLQNLMRNQSIDTRGTLSSNVLTEVSNTVSRLAMLSKISDCTSILEGKFPVSTTNNKKQKTQHANMSPLMFLLEMAKRGEADEETTAQFAAVEDDLCTSIVKTLMFYFMWKIITLKALLDSNDVRQLSDAFFEDLEHNKSSMAEVLELVIAKRTPLDQVRVVAVSASLDLFTLFSTLRHFRPAKGPALEEELAARVEALVSVMPREVQLAAMVTHDRLEKSFARKTRRKLEDVPGVEPGEDDAPIDSDDEDDGDEDEDDDELEGGLGKEARKQGVLMTEQRLCDITGKIVLAVVGRVAEEGEKIRERLVRNRLRLGANYKEVLGYLDEKDKRKSASTRAKGGEGASGKPKKARQAEPTEKVKSTVMVVEDDDIEDDDEGMLERRDEDDDEALVERGLVEDDVLDEPEATPEADVAADDDDGIGD